MTRTNDDRNIGDLEEIVSARLKELYPVSIADLPTAPVNLSEYRRSRRLERSITLGIAAAAVLAVVAGGAIELGHRGGSTQAPIANSASISPSSAAPTAAPCATADLKVSAQPSTFGMNSEGLIFSVTNTGSSPCAVPDHVTDIHGQEADGTDVAIDASTSSRLTGTTPGPLGPGGTATFALETGNPSMCSSSTRLKTVTSISLVFGTDATLKATLPAADALTLGCGGVGVTEVGVSNTGSSGKATAAATTADVKAARTLPHKSARAPR